MADLPHYTIVKAKATLAPECLPPVMAKLEKRWPEAKINRGDGLRLDWDDRWVHLRPSNTEPIVRIIAEAPAADDARRLCREVSQELASPEGKRPE